MKRCEILTCFLVVVEQDNPLTRGQARVGDVDGREHVLRTMRWAVKFMVKFMVKRW